MSAMKQPEPVVAAGPAVGSPPGDLGLVERRGWSMNGFVGIVLGLLATPVFMIALMAVAEPGLTGAQLAAWSAVVVVCGLSDLWVLTSLATVQPGQVLVLQFLGQYVGTVARTGFTLLPPLVTRRRVSVRVRNFETGTLKVNDGAGNPVEIAAIVVWHVADAARSVFQVEQAEDFIRAQADAAVRHIARSYPYDAPEDVESLRGATDQVAQQMRDELNVQVGVAGLRIVDVRVAHLAYAPEIAQAMLQRQQASALIAARGLIVTGAVGMVRDALAQLSDQGVVDLDEDRKAAMVSNLLVVLCGDSRVTPVVGAGAGPS